jgi:hypothetical protein
MVTPILTKWTAIRHERNHATAGTSDRVHGSQGLRERTSCAAANRRRVGPPLVEALGACQFAEPLVERAEGQVPDFPSDLQYQTIRKTDTRRLAVLLERRPYNVAILKCQLLMRQQHLDYSCDLCATEIVCVGEDPDCLGEHDMRHPHALRHELFRRFDLGT